MALSKPISTTAVANALGTSIRTWSGLNTSNAIRWQSWYKPMSSPKNVGSQSDGEFTTDERRYCNWGWGGLNGGVDSTNLPAMLLAKLQGATWYHAKPTGGIGISPFRRLDWNKYDPAADTPFKMTITTLNNGTQSLGAVMRIEIADFYTELQRHLNKWGHFYGETLANMGLGFYITNSTTSVPTSNPVYMMACYNGLYRFTDLGSSDEIKDFSISTAYLSRFGAGTYYIVPFIVSNTTNFTPSSTDNSTLISNLSGKFMVLSEAAQRVTFSEVVNPIDKVSVSIWDNSQVYVDLNRVYVPSLVLRVRNNNTTSQTVNITVTPKAGNIVGTMSGSFATRNLTIAASSYTNTNVVSNTPNWEVYTIGGIVVTVTIVVGTSSKTVDLTIYSDKE